MKFAVSFTLAALLTGPALADPAPEPSASEPAVPVPPPVPEPPPVPAPVLPDPRLTALEERLAKLEDALDQAKDDTKYLEDQLATRFPVKLGGYLDVGFFATTGNGAGTRADLAGTYFPEYAGKVPSSWVFMGDPLSTAVNSRGEPADTGDSRAITFDPIDAQGNSSFLVNAVNFALFTGLGETASVQTSIDFVPRRRDIGNPNGTFLGDFLDVKLAYAEWKPRLEAVALALQAGKFDSVLGYEYRGFESPDRLGVTPSLLCRYTCGRPVGLKARAIFTHGGDDLIANVAVTNGSHFSEGFSFHDETDTNQFKTLAGRVSYTLAHAVELGVSGAFGAQDLQPRNDVYQWHVGADLHVDWHDVEFTAEYIQGKARGETTPVAVAPCDLAPCIHYKAAYGLIGYRLTNTFTPYLRVDWRDALHQSGASFVYISELARATVGLRAEIGTRVILKAEGTLNRELGRIPQFPNDVVTTSLVIRY
ncbi:MAG: hypothetical protein NT062_26780 [Proteobacteria bacterium]|nr:hypothetical protein [Pseudomonadota bacterium]